ncbi:MAG: hypothetical protein PHV13_04795 [Candidatus ainarchaeum sp.]|nr:hypothetical protein [Candidatus ainarchaeum sp.]
MRGTVVFVLAAVLLCSLCFAASDTESAQKVAQKAAERLGWPTTTYSSVEDSGIPGSYFLVSADGQAEDSDQYGYVTVLSNDLESAYHLKFITEWLDGQDSSYQGRSASIVTGGKNCNPRGLVKILNQWAVGFFESIFGESDDPDKYCVNEAGVVAFSCGKYMVVAIDTPDDESTGAEYDIASAFYTAAQEEGLCDYGDTLVIMADTSDRTGATGLGQVTRMAQRINEYYGINSYGAYPPFKFSFKDADGSRGNADWYRVDNTLASYNYPNGNVPFGVDAVKKAFAGADMPEDLYLERIVVVFAGDGHQKDNTAKFSNACSWFNDNSYIEVDASQGKRKVYVKNIILLSENRELGGWVHEFGHSMYSRVALPGGWNRISDRYNYDANTAADRQYGEMHHWDLMGSGSHWGPKDGDIPPQMSAFTKVTATWLEYANAAVNTSYVLTPVELMQKGSTVLRLDDPEFPDAEYYYVIEARDSGGYFGAPESGVVISRVWFDQGHHVVNALRAQAAPNLGTASWGQKYIKPTLYSVSGNASMYTNVPGEFRIRMLEAGASPKITIEEFKPANLAGAVAAPTGGGVNGGGNATSTENAMPGTMPDEDLHAYDGQGRHVGMNYQTEEYENQIPGAIASGDLVGAPEWIFVPEGTDVRYEISTYRTQQFLSANPQLAPYAAPQTFDTTLVKFDASGARYEADGGAGSASAGKTVQIKGPADPSLKYQKKQIPGFSANASCPVMPAILLLTVSLALFQGFMRRGAFN